MRRRLAYYVTDRMERFQWVPRRLACWASDYIFAHSKPVEVRVRDGGPVIWRGALVEVNPKPKTWATGSSITITYPPSPENPYA